MPPHRAWPISRLLTAVDVLGSVRAMRCTACDAELVLTKMAPDVVRGFEHQQFHLFGMPCHGASTCSLCDMAVRSHGARDRACTITHRTCINVQAEQIAAPGLFSPMVAKMRGR